MPFPTSIRLMSDEDKAREAQEREQRRERAFSQGYYRALNDLCYALGPAASSLGELAVAHYQELNSLACWLSAGSLNAMADELSRLLTRLHSLALDHLALKAEVAALRAKDERQQKELMALRLEAEVDTVNLLRQELEAAQVVVETVNAEKAELSWRIEYLEGEIARQNAVIVEFSERLKPARPATQK